MDMPDILLDLDLDLLDIVQFRIYMDSRSVVSMDLSEILDMDLDPFWVRTLMDLHSSRSERTQIQTLPIYPQSGSIPERSIYPTNQLG